ncbi:MAG: hypothetical protein ACXW30_06935 [Micavibrio sp.]
MTDPDFKAIGRQARDLAEAADSDLARGIGREVSRTARQESRKLMEELSITGSTCGRLIILFKDAAQEGYGVASMQFDKQGNVVMSEAHDAGSDVAMGTVNDMKRGAAGTTISEGQNVISQIAPTCKL